MSGCLEMHSESFLGLAIWTGQEYKKKKKKKKARMMFVAVVVVAVDYKA